MKLRKTVFRVYILPLLCVVCLMFLLQGCTLRRTGKTDSSYFSVKTSESLVGLAKSEIIDTFGLSDGTATDEEGVEYWSYKNTRHYHFILLGRSKQKNLILQFDDDRVTSVELKDAGASWHFSLPPLFLQ